MNLPEYLTAGYGIGLLVLNLFVWRGVLREIGKHR